MWELQHERGKDVKSNNEISHNKKSASVFNIVSTQPRH